MPRQFNSAEHESLRAMIRCLFVNFGHVRVADEMLRFMGVSSEFELSPWGANYCRKKIERHLPLRGEFDPL